MNHKNCAKATQTTESEGNTYTNTLGIHQAHTHVCVKMAKENSIKLQELTPNLSANEFLEPQVKVLPNAYAR